MPPPESGYGPVNYARPGHIDPFAAFDNRIRYNDMIRQQMVSQYQQSTVQPTSMTLGMQRHVAQDPRFQYGVPGGQDPRHYQRQAQLKNMGIGSAVAKTVMDIGAWEAGAGIAAGLKAVGMGFFGAGIAVPAIAAGAALYMPMRGINNAMQRQTFMHGMAADIEQYRETLGFRGGLSYNQTTNLAGSLQRNMYQGGFFDKDQQSQIHKIALSNNMISARGGGTASGSLRQYEKNFDELKETTEEVVKLLQTTIEGGMSVIKELQGSGFGTMKSVRHQVRQAKAFGSLTGMGAQNMMLQGAAGAQAVQGTPWAANVGASMYQSGAAQASTMSRMGPVGTYAVQRAGGVAAAGGVLANAQMNVLSSGMGTKAVAYAMRADGTVDEGRMNRLMSGRVGAYEMVVGASERGYAMGPSGRVLFERNKEDVLNNMSDIGRAQMVNRTFQAWGQGRYGTTEAKAWVFAGQFTNNQRDQRLFSENLLRPKGFDDQYAAMQASRASLTQVQIKRPLGPVGGAITSGLGAAGQYFDRMGEDIVYGSGRAIEAAGKFGKAIGTDLSQAYEGTMQGLGIYDKYGGINRAGPIDAEAAVRSQYSMGRQESALGARGLVMTSPSGFSALENVKKSKLKVDYGKLVSKDPKMAAYLYQQIGGALQLGKTGDILENPQVLRGLGIIPGSATFKEIEQNPMGYANRFLTSAKTYRRSINKQYEDQTTEWDRLMVNLQPSERKKMLDMKFEARFYKEMTGYSQHEMMLGKNNTQGIGMGLAQETAIGQADIEYKKKNSDIAGAELHEKTIDLEGYAKTKRDAIYADTFGFEMEEVTTSSRVGGIKTEMRETRATKIKKRKMAEILGPGFHFGDAAGQQTAAEELDRLIETFDKPKLTKFAKLEGKAGPEYYGSPEYTERRAKERAAGLQYEKAEALEIRRGQANKFADYLRYNLGEDVSSKQEKVIKGLFTGKTRAADVGAGVIDLIAAGSVMDPKEVKKHFDAGTAGFVLGKNEAAISKDQMNEVEKARIDLARASTAKDMADNVVGRIGGKKAETAATEKNIEYLKTKERYDNLTQVITSPDSSRGKESYASVQPPILNYWNNRWTL